MFNMKKLVMLSVGFLFASSALAGDSAAITQKILEQTMDRGIEILKDDSMGPDARINAFEALLKENCQTDLMAYCVLGKPGWRKLSEEQRPEFIHAFIQMITRSYYSKMDMADISTLKISYGDNEKVSSIKRVIKAAIEDDTDTYDLEYKFAFREGRWGIYDLKVEGVSLLASYRSEYKDYLARHNGAELIEMLKQKAAECGE